MQKEQLIAKLKAAKRAGTSYHEALSLMKSAANQALAGHVRVLDAVYHLQPFRCQVCGSCTSTHDDGTFKNHGPGPNGKFLCPGSRRKAFAEQDMQLQMALPE